MQTSVIEPRSRREAAVEWLRHFNKRATNRLTMRFAGRHIYAVVHHRGRKTGQQFQTPVVAVPGGDGFYFPLPYGERVDWLRNIRAAGECEMEWRGQFYRLGAPQTIEPAEAVAAFPQWLHPLLRNTAVYLKMKTLDEPAFMPMRKILVLGAGVLGSFYAGKLYKAGYDVTLLARGERLAELQERGLLLQEDGQDHVECLPVAVTGTLGPEDAYDLVMVIVRKNQIPGVLPMLAANTRTPNVLFLVNNAAGGGELAAALGSGRVVLGFPCAGGQRSGGVVRYQDVSASQPTTIGELHGRRTARLAAIAALLRGAGLETAVSDNIEAWLKTHVALISPLANALYLAGGSNYRLVKTRDGLVLLVRAVKEGLRVLDALRIPITPASFRIFRWLPEPLLVRFLEKRMGSERVELLAARHANAARDEMTCLAEEFHALALQSGVRTPAIDRLRAYADPAEPPMPEGSARIPVAWGPPVAAAGALISAGLLLAWVKRKRTH